MSTFVSCENVSPCPRERAVPEREQALLGRGERVRLEPAQLARAGSPIPRAPGRCEVCLEARIVDRLISGSTKACASPISVQQILELPLAREIRRVRAVLRSRAARRNARAARCCRPSAFSNSSTSRSVSADSPTRPFNCSILRYSDCSFAKCRLHASGVGKSTVRSQVSSGFTWSRVITCAPAASSLSWKMEQRGKSFTPLRSRRARAESNFGVRQR